MERLVKVGINAKGGFNYQVVLDSYEDIKVLIKLYKELEKEGLIPRNNILKQMKIYHIGRNRRKND